MAQVNEDGSVLVKVDEHKKILAWIQHSGAVKSNERCCNLKAGANVKLTANWSKIERMNWPANHRMRELKSDWVWWGSSLQVMEKGVWVFPTIKYTVCVNHWDKGNNKGDQSRSGTGKGGQTKGHNKGGQSRRGGPKLGQRGGGQGKGSRKGKGKHDAKNKNKNIN